MPDTLPTDVQLLDKDLSSVTHLPNLQHLHSFVESLLYQEKHGFVTFLNYALLCLLEACKHTEKCLWMLFQVYKRHEFPIEVGCLQFLNINKRYEDKWYWNELKKACAFVFIDDEYKEVIQKTRKELQELKSRYSQAIDTELYDSLMSDIRKNARL